MNYSGSSKKRVGVIFQVSTSRMQLVYPTDVQVMILECLSCHAANGLCLNLLVPPLPQYITLLWCFLLNITACTTAEIGGHTLKRKTPFAMTLFKKGCRLISKDRLILGSLR